MEITPYTRMVFYHETDRMDIVNHSNYIHMAEEARVDFMEKIGIGKNELTRKVHKKLPMIPVDLVSMVCAFTAATKFNGIKAAFSKLGVWIKKKSVRCWRNRL